MTLLLLIAWGTGLDGAAGLGAAGWASGLAYGVVVCVALTRGLHRAGSRRLGPADRVTLARATLVGGVTALTADSFHRHAPVVLLVAVTAVALSLDAVDGKVARRTNTVSALGARFDMEVDAFLILVLGIYLVPTFGVWVLAMGVMRYAFVAASWVLPWMRNGLPPRLWRKVVAATQGIVLAVAASDAVPRPLMTAFLVAALALLLESFGHDVGWLWQHGRSHRRHLPRPVSPRAARSVRVPAERHGAASAPVVARAGDGMRRVPAR